MYLEHFKLTKAPFTLTPNTDFFCELPTYQEALNVLLLSLADGQGFIKIVGEVGTGKTLLCRILLHSLDETFVTAYIPNPDQTPEGLRMSIAKELGIVPSGQWSFHELFDAINERLLLLHRAGKKTVLIIDEAQAMPSACLETIRLLTNLETEEQKLMQVVLFGQPELNKKLADTTLRQLNQRITFSYTLKPLMKEELEKYVCHRLSKAGYTYGSVFTRGAIQRLYRGSRGLPRLLNILCHKALLVAYGKGELQVDKKAVRRAIRDTESAYLQHPLLYGLMMACGVVLAMLIWYGLYR